LTVDLDMVVAPKVVSCRFTSDEQRQLRTPTWCFHATVVRLLQGITPVITVDSRS
jgi:hypothetical protein